MDWRDRNKDRLQSKHQKFMRMKENREAQLMNAMIIHERFAVSIMALMRQTHLRPLQKYTSQIRYVASNIHLSLVDIAAIKKSGTVCFPRKESLRISMNYQRMGAMR